MRSRRKTRTGWQLAWHRIGREVEQDDSEQLHINSRLYAINTFLIEELQKIKTVLHNLCWERVCVD